MPTVIPFVPPSQMSCFNITFPGDTEYEFHEALKMTIDTSGSGLNPGTIAEADVVITDDDSKTIVIIKLYVHVYTWMHAHSHAHRHTHSGTETARHAGHCPINLLNVW